MLRHSRKIGEYHADPDEIVECELVRLLVEMNELPTLGAHAAMLAARCRGRVLELVQETPWRVCCALRAAAAGWSSALKRRARIGALPLSGSSIPCAHRR